MINVEKNISLKEHNTFRIPVFAKYFIEVKNIDEVIETFKFIRENNLNFFILGGGANVLFTKDFDGVIIKNSLKGIDKVKEDDDNVILKVLSGEKWIPFVKYCVDNNFSGIENLAYIPGTVGASPVQNIAAYGQEVSSNIISVEAINLETMETKEFTHDECNFKYRHSIFKGELKNKYFILSVTFKLSKVFDKGDTSYHSRNESLAEEIKSIASEPYTLRNIFDAVVSIRKKKLPDVAEIGTVGSMFANPFLTNKQFEKLKEKIPNIQYYPIDKMQYPNMKDLEEKHLEVVKIPAGWLLDEAGWKNKQIGNISTHKNHALCVVTYDNATGEEAFDYTEAMRKDIKEKFDIDLDYEVNVI